MKQLYPGRAWSIGPVIEDGFYYDIAYERPFTPEDLAAIEARMRELIAKDYDVIKRVTPRDEAVEVFRERGEDYKLRSSTDMPDEERDGPVSPGRVRRHVPRPARAEHAASCARSS